MISKQEQKKINQLKTKARKLVKIGFSYREVGKMVDRSREWVRQAMLSYPQRGLDKKLTRIKIKKIK